MLTNTTEMLLKASREHYGVGAFNVNNLEAIQGIMSAVKDKKSPVIIQASQGAIKYAGLDYLVAMVSAAAKQVETPVALNLDHGASADLAIRCINAGFTSVMIDSSTLPWDENIAVTKEVVAYAHNHGISVEAEIGTICGTEDNISVDEKDATYTNPEQAAAFVAATQIDSLAVAIGTAHGIYQGEPKLDFERLAAIRMAIPNTPIVLHGSSGVAADSLKKAIDFGVSKINIDTDLRIAFICTLRNELAAQPDQIDPRKLLGPAREALARAVSNKIDIFGSANRN